MLRKNNSDYIYKVQYCKGGTGGYSAKVQLPKEFLKDLDFHPGDYIEYTRVPHGLLLRKVDRNVKEES